MGCLRVVQHAHAEAAGATRDRAADRAEADEAEGRAVDVAAELLGYERASPPRRPPRRLASASCISRARGDDQAEGEVGRRLDQRLSACQHLDAARRCAAASSTASEPAPATAIARSRGIRASAAASTRCVGAQMQRVGVGVRARLALDEDVP